MISRADGFKRDDAEREGLPSMNIFESLNIA
jgi:hypothetical protein